MTDLFAALDATWPAVAHQTAGGWLVRQGANGGKRVSSATAIEPTQAAASIAAAEAAHAALGQPPLFCLRPGDEAADHALAERGYQILDPVHVFTATVAQVAADGPEHLSSFAIWPALAITEEIWGQGHIGPARRTVMDRVRGPKTTILGRAGDRAAGAVFVALHGDVAMIHALHVDPSQRRQGLARNLMRAAAAWAADQRATHLALAVTEANVPACALYHALGMQISARYHYRAK